MVIKNSGNVRVTVVTAEVMVALTVCSVRLFDVCVKLLKVVDLEPHVFVALAESKVVLRHVVRSCKIIDDAVSATYAGMTDAWHEP